MNEHSLFKPVARLALAFYALAALPAHAEWQAGIGASLRHAVNTESDGGGRRLVRESGWLPGVALQAAYRSGALTWLGAADWCHGSLGYDGRTQAGTAAISTTATTLAAWRAGVAWTLFDDTRLLAALEADRWRRDIAGVAGGAGLQERYRATRLLLGAARDWRPAAGLVTAEASLFRSGAERIDVGFSNLFDPASVDGSRNHGARVGIALRPAGAPWLELHTRVDWSTAPHSRDVPLTAGGQFRGSVAQPEHVRQAATFTLSVMY